MSKCPSCTAEGFSGKCNSCGYDILHATKSPKIAPAAGPTPDKGGLRKLRNKILRVKK